MKKLSILICLISFIGLTSSFAPSTDNKPHVQLTFEKEDGSQLKMDLQNAKLEHWKFKLVDAYFMERGQTLACEALYVYSPVRGDAVIMAVNQEVSLLNALQSFQEQYSKHDRIIIDNIRVKGEKNTHDPIVYTVFDK